MKTLKPLILRITITTLLGLLLWQIGVAVQVRLSSANAPTTRTAYSWAYHPEDLKQAYELSDLVIVGEVTSVMAGPTLEAETTSPDHPIVTLDSTLVHLLVTTPLNGKVETGSEITVYRQINIAENSGPTQHTVGEKYLLFLGARPEGDYYILFAEGNYHVAKGRLIWSWATLADRDASFAKQLEGDSFETVLQQIASLK